MYTTTKNPPREAVLFPGGVLLEYLRTNVSRETFCGELAGRRPGGGAAEMGFAHLPAGTAGGLRPVSWILQRLPQQLPEDQH